MNFSGFLSPRANGEDSCVIINNCLVPIGQGIHGRDFKQAAGLRRRPVLVGNDGNRLLKADRFYSRKELMGKNGKPVKIVSIPDRTKGGFPPLERVLVFLDLANIDNGAREYGGMDYRALLENISNSRFLVEAFAYVPIDPRNPHGRDDLIRELQTAGWMVIEKMGKPAGESYKCNVDVEICIDIMRSAQQIRPDIIVLCSGDGDFIPVVRELRRMGIRAEVASFESCADHTLPLEASGFISLDVWLRESGRTVPGNSGKRRRFPHSGICFPAPEQAQDAPQEEGGTGLREPVPVEEPEGPFYPQWRQAF